MKNQLIFILMLIVFTSTILDSQTNLRDKISQMIMVGFWNHDLDNDYSIIYDIQESNIGGVILYAHNITSANQLEQLTSKLQSFSSNPLFISIDQEGGVVARLNESNGYYQTQSAHEIGTYINDESETRWWANFMSQWLADGGININLAPVVDVNVNPTSPAIGNLDRSFSRIVDTVYHHAFWFIDEFSKKSILTTLKHFPGHGSAVTDSHLGFTDITNTWADSELVPFQRLIHSGFDGLIMIGHLFNKNLDKDYPASLSKKIINGLLRDSLGFKGLIITDEMLMGAIRNNYDMDQAVTLAINAGNDILLFRDNHPSWSWVCLVPRVIDIVVNKITQGIITESRIDESYNRIMMKKQSLTSLRNLSTQLIPNTWELINYPNPFNSITTIRYCLPERKNIKLKVYDILGNEIEKLVDEEKSPGTYAVTWNAVGLPSGVYFYQLRAGSFVETKKMVLLR